MHKVLIYEGVEDVADRLILELIHGGFACEARRVDTPEDFARQLDIYFPDAILCCASPPKSNGQTALAIARSLRPETPILFVFGTIGEEIAVRAIKSEPNDHIFKTSSVEFRSSFKVALADAELGEALGELRHLPGRVGERERLARSVLVEADERLVAGTFARPAVHAGAGDVEAAAVEPRRPLPAARRVDDGRPRLRELDPEVGDDLRPEALGLLDRDPVQLRVRARVESAHQPGEVRALDELRGGLPDEPGHPLRNPSPFG